MTYGSGKFKNVSRELLGHVGVDSGQLMIMDPCYVENQWVNEKQSEAHGIRFWGRDSKEMTKALTAQGHKVEEANGSYMAQPAEGDDIDDLHMIIEGMINPEKMWVVCSRVTESTYDRICEITTGAEGGSIPYKMGHEGLAVAFSSGLGDGFYAVYANYADIDGWGRRITKVEIEMIVEEDEDEDLFEEEMEDEEDELSSEPTSGS